MLNTPSWADAGRALPPVPSAWGAALSGRADVLFCELCRCGHGLGVRWGVPPLAPGAAIGWGRRENRGGGSTGPPVDSLVQWIASVPFFEWLDVWGACRRRWDDVLCPGSFSSSVRDRRVNPARFKMSLPPRTDREMFLTIFSGLGHPEPSAARSGGGCALFSGRAVAMRRALRTMLDRVCLSRVGVHARFNTVDFRGNQCQRVRESAGLSMKSPARARGKVKDLPLPQDRGFRLDKRDNCEMAADLIGVPFPALQAYRMKIFRHLISPFQDGRIGGDRVPSPPCPYLRREGSRGSTLRREIAGTSLR